MSTNLSYRIETNERSQRPREKLVEVEHGLLGALDSLDENTVVKHVLRAAAAAGLDNEAPEFARWEAQTGRILDRIRERIVADAAAKAEALIEEYKDTPRWYDPKPGAAS